MRWEGSTLSDRGSYSGKYGDSGAWDSARTSTWTDSDEIPEHRGAYLPQGTLLRVPVRDTYRACLEPSTAKVSVTPPSASIHPHSNCTLFVRDAPAMENCKVHITRLITFFLKISVVGVDRAGGKSRVLCYTNSTIYIHFTQTCPPRLQVSLLRLARDFAAHLRYCMSNKLPEQEMTERIPWRDVSDSTWLYLKIVSVQGVTSSRFWNAFRLSVSSSSSVLKLLLPQNCLSSLDHPTSLPLEAWTVLMPRASGKSQRGDTETEGLSRLTVFNIVSVRTISLSFCRLLSCPSQLWAIRGTTATNTRIKKRAKHRLMASRPACFFQKSIIAMRLSKSDSQSNPPDYQSMTLSTLHVRAQATIIIITKNCELDFILPFQHHQFLVDVCFTIPQSNNTDVLQGHLVVLSHSATMVRSHAVVSLSLFLAASQHASTAAPFFGSHVPLTAADPTNAVVLMPLLFLASCKRENSREKIHAINNNHTWTTTAIRWLIWTVSVFKLAAIGKNLPGCIRFSREGMPWQSNDMSRRIYGIGRMIGRPNKHIERATTDDVMVPKLQVSSSAVHPKSEFIASQWTVVYPTAKVASMFDFINDEAEIAPGGFDSRLLRLLSLAWRHANECHESASPASSTWAALNTALHPLKQHCIPMALGQRVHSSSHRLYPTAPTSPSEVVAKLFLVQHYERPSTCSRLHVLDVNRITNTAQGNNGAFGSLSCLGSSRLMDRPLAHSIFILDQSNVRTTALSRLDPAAISVKNRLRISAPVMTRVLVLSEQPLKAFEPTDPYTFVRDPWFIFHEPNSDLAIKINLVSTSLFPLSGPNVSFCGADSTLQQFDDRVLTGIGAYPNNAGFLQNWKNWNKKAACTMRRGVHTLMVLHSIKRGHHGDVHGYSHCTATHCTLNDDEDQIVETSSGSHPSVGLMRTWPFPYPEQLPGPLASRPPNEAPLSTTHLDTGSPRYQGSSQRWQDNIEIDWVYRFATSRAPGSWILSDVNIAPLYLCADASALRSAGYNLVHDRAGALRCSSVVTFTRTGATFYTPHLGPSLQRRRILHIAYAANDHGTTRQILNGTAATDKKMNHNAMIQMLHCEWILTRGPGLEDLLTAPSTLPSYLAMSGSIILHRPSADNSANFQVPHHVNETETTASGLCRYHVRPQTVDDDETTSDLVSRHPSTRKQLHMPETSFLNNLSGDKVVAPRALKAPTLLRNNTVRTQQQASSFTGPSYTKQSKDLTLRQPAISLVRRRPMREVYTKALSTNFWLDQAWFLPQLISTTGRVVTLQQKEDTKLPSNHGPWAILCQFSLPPGSGDRQWSSLRRKSESSYHIGPATSLVDSMPDRGGRHAFACFKCGVETAFHPGNLTCYDTGKEADLIPVEGEASLYGTRVKTQLAKRGKPLDKTAIGRRFERLANPTTLSLVGRSLGLEMLTWRDYHTLKS
ncbi:uncharacterized protein CLUP02_10784 [Colletotrichum lupini]|uniref:Uncharacterized protein n=1 Tax=Colletotrichum lupini TaxID=145971 RepID=A0A9Q8SXC6_9PEZI|nr:uncharacterized protein CLUP02_10784 [Colletotrichum lupini]UQC85287.1 hypothetical protein CLUP02_10784 [Colletotrichum lupini]